MISLRLLCELLTYFNTYKHLYLAYYWILKESWYCVVSSVYFHRIILVTKRSSVKLSFKVTGEPCLRYGSAFDIWILKTFSSSSCLSRPKVVPNGFVAIKWSIWQPHVFWDGEGESLTSVVRLYTSRVKKTVNFNGIPSAQNRAYKLELQRYEVIL